jgi:hypothetical protein
MERRGDMGGIEEVAESPEETDPPRDSIRQFASSPDPVLKEFDRGRGLKDIVLEHDRQAELSGLGGVGF